MDLLPELQIKVISVVSFEQYNNIRLVCQEWYQIIEDSDYKNVLYLARRVYQPPDYTHDNSHGYWGIKYSDGQLLSNDDKMYKYNGVGLETVINSEKQIIQNTCSHRNANSEMTFVLHNKK